MKKMSVRVLVWNLDSNTASMDTEHRNQNLTSIQSLKDYDVTNFCSK